MPRKRKKPRIVEVRRFGGRRISARVKYQGRVPRNAKPLAELPGFEQSLPSRHLRLLFDEDTKALAQLIEAPVYIEHVYDLGLSGRSDPEIAEYARRNGRILVTFNHVHYFTEKHGVYLNKCYGIVTVNGRNDDASFKQIAALNIDNLIHQLGRNVRKDWWVSTKIAVKRDAYVMQRLVNGSRVKYDIRPDSSGVLWFRQRKR